MGRRSTFKRQLPCSVDSDLSRAWLMKINLGNKGADPTRDASTDDLAEASLVRDEPDPRWSFAQVSSTPGVAAVRGSSVPGRSLMGSSPPEELAPSYA